MDSAQGGDFAPIFGDLSQSEKLSEIKPPLAKWQQPLKNEPQECLAMIESRLICNICAAEIQKIFASILLWSFCEKGTFKYIPILQFSRWL